jgi:UPF0716 family protein affecting phage T7 exclusion
LADPEAEQPAQARLEGTLDDPRRRANLAGPEKSTLVKSIFLAFLLLVAAEITVFIAVAREIGVGIALLLVLVASVAGAILLKRAGRKQIEKVRRAMAQRTPIAVESADVMLVVCGILLLIPGFVTDLAGLALFVPAVRRWLARTGRHLVERRRTRRPGAVIELERDKWRRVREDRIEDRSDRH